MAWSEVRTVLLALTGAECQFWLEGGWGVDALAGRQTRPHRDVDVDLDASQESRAMGVLADLGYEIETDWRPNRVELVAPGAGRVDLHPLILAADGSAQQAALEGGYHYFPRSYLTVGRLNGLAVPCVSVKAQRAFRQGYELRPVDRHDLAVLESVPAAE